MAETVPAALDAMASIVATRSRLAAAVRAEADRHLGGHWCIAAWWEADWDCDPRARLIAALTGEEAT